MSDEPKSPQAQFSIAFAGPFVNLMFISVGLIIYPFVHTDLMVLIIGVNVLILGFNMIPAFPMDGGQILNSIIWYLWGREIAYKITISLSYIFCCVGLGIGLYFGYVSLTIISLVIGGMAYAQAFQNNLARNQMHVKTHQESQDGNVRPRLSSRVTEKSNGNNGEKA